jgi:hypothetical protein
VCCTSKFGLLWMILFGYSFVCVSVVLWPPTQQSSCWERDGWGKESEGRGETVSVGDFVYITFFYVSC